MAKIDYNELGGWSEPSINLECTNGKQVITGATFSATQLVNPCLESLSMSTTNLPPANLMAIPYKLTSDRIEFVNF